MASAIVGRIMCSTWSQNPPPLRRSDWPPTGKYGNPHSLNFTAKSGDRIIVLEEELQRAHEVWIVIIILLMVEPPTLTAEQNASLKKLLSGFDYTHNASCGIIYHLAAYWKARRHQLIEP